MFDLENWLPEIVFFVLGGIVTALVLFIQRQSKTLDWEPIADESILAGAASHPSLKSGLDVLWDGYPLDEPRIVSLRIQNTGRKEVRAEEYSTPISIFMPDAKIFDAMVTAVSEQDVHPIRSIRYDNPNAQNMTYIELVEMPAILRPQFLNRGDSIEVQMIVSGIQGKLNVSSRFAGQSRSMRNILGRDLSRRAWLIMAIAVLFLIPPLVISLGSAGTSPPLSTILQVCVIVGVVLYWVAVIYGNRYDKLRGKRSVTATVRSLWQKRRPPKNR